MSEDFDPSNHNFELLVDFGYPGNVSAYELRNHPSVNGEPHFTRLNVYLSKDGNYVRVWFGFLDAVVADSRLQVVEKPDGIDLTAAYEESLFAGWIDSDEQASHILRAIRPGNYLPQEVRADARNRIACVDLDATAS